MDLGSGRLESSSRIQQRDSGTAADTWPTPGRRRHKSRSPAAVALADQEDVLEGSDDEWGSHQLDDIA